MIEVHIKRLMLLRQENPDGDIRSQLTTLGYEKGPDGRLRRVAGPIPKQELIIIPRHTRSTGVRPGPGRLGPRGRVVR